MVDFTDGHPRHRASTAAVLEFAWDAGAFRADHVIAALGLTRSTALSALDALIDVGLIRELPHSGNGDGYRMGRPARRFELRGEAGLVVGIDAGNLHFVAAVADLSGRILAQRRIDSTGFQWSKPNPQTDPEMRRRAAFQAIDEALELAGGTRDEVVAVGVGVPAPVDREGRSPRHPAGFWQYMNADLGDILGDVFPAVRVENDAALAAVAEATLGEARGYDDFVAMLSGRRLGSGVFLEGRLVRGGHGGVGEMEALAYVAGVGGTWGLADLAEKWVAEARDDGRIPPEHPWAARGAAPLTAEEILAGTTPGDPVLAALYEHLGAKLGLICNVVSRFYDPERIVVCGSATGALGPVIEIAQQHVAEDAELPPPEVVASQLGGDVVSLGAVSAAREAAREIVLPLLTERRRVEETLSRHAAI
ncbi:MAG: ROK family protein [Arachnia sp.]